ncbi:MAG: AIR carboxylase family protein [Candidatus Bathyarchaeota archaeon]|nr:AIR carboxylase family protein [Candidatus Bathyarchaeota archaeon]
MALGKIVVFMGSKRDYEFASRIGKFLQDENFNVECEYVVASAHKTPKKLLDEVEKHEKTGGPMVFITVAGLSDALSGVVAGCSRYPVVACPPDSEKFGYAKFFSSVVTPQGVAVAYVPRPENAALSAVRILALSDEKLRRKVEAYMRRLREGVKA